MQTLREALRSATEQLVTSSTPRLDAQLLLCHLLGVEKPYLFAHDDRQLTAAETERYEALVRRREAGEPIAYIVGTKGFYGLDFAVTPDVLVPRPETEHLVEAALAWAEGNDNLVAADIGTGSGAIAVSVKHHAPELRMHAVDISAVALAIAQENAAHHAAEITFHQGSLAEPLLQAGIQVDLLLANLPYIPSETTQQLAVSQHEPHLALDGGEDGLDLIRQLLGQVPTLCHAGALVLLEIGAEQGAAVIEFAQHELELAEASVLPDLAGLDRVVRLRLND